MGELLPIILEILNNVSGIINTKIARKYVDDINEIEKDLLEEKSRGADADDAKIGMLYKEREVALKSLNQELILAKSK